jgi:predicted aldo/keto reductase-like oxidoreductase
MRLPMKDGKIDEERAIRQIRHAIDRGVNYVDSAWPYHAGQSEIVLGKALKNGYRDKVKLATKLPSWMIKTRADMDRYLAAQLEKLGTDRIDYYLLHSLNGGSWDILHGLGVEGFLDQAKADGRIVNAGFSFHGLKPDFMRIVDAYPWVFAQIQFNYLDEQYQAGVEGLRYAASKGLGMIVMEPLRGGNLGVAAPPAVEAIWNESPTRRTPAEWALRWIWNQPEPTVVLSGMNDEAQIDENLATADAARPGSLTDAELALVERAGRKYRELMKVGCTGCGYCMPCPAGVTIPICFEEYNRYHMFGRSEDVKYRYALRMSGELVDGKPGYASQCVRCGKCLEKCPQQIRIPDRLAEVAADMDGPQLAARLAAVRTVFKIEAK